MYKENDGSTELAVKKIRDYEYNTTKEIEGLINLIQSMESTKKAEKIAALLHESLLYIQNAKTQQELEVYRLSFIAALEQMRIKDILDIETCVESLRSAAHDLFEYTTLIANKNLKSEDSDFLIAGPTQSALIAVTSFSASAEALKTEFEEKINHNLQVIRKNSSAEGTKIEFDANNQPHDSAIKEDYKASQQENLELKRSNMKYQTGLQRIDEQKYKIGKAFALIQKIPQTEQLVDKQNLRADLNDVLNDVSQIEQRTGYNHFIKNCAHKVNALCESRSTYLKKEQSTLKFAAKAAMEVASAFVHLVPAIPDMPDEFASFTNESIVSAMELAEHAAPKLVKEAVRESFSYTPPRLSFWQKTSNFFKKAASVAMGVGLLAVAGAVCLTGVGLPKGIAMGASALEILNVVRKGKDIFSHYREQNEYHQEVKERLTVLEEKHTELNKLTQIENKISAKDKINHYVHGLSSESKIDLLLMGHKPTDILTKEELERLKNRHESVEVKSTEPQQMVSQDQTLQQNTIKVFEPGMIDEEQDGEGESGVHPRFG